MSTNHIEIRYSLNVLSLVNVVSEVSFSVYDYTTSLQPHFILGLLIRFALVEFLQPSTSPYSVVRHVY